MGGLLSRAATEQDEEEVELREEGEVSMDFESEESVHCFVQEQYHLSRGGRCPRCRPPQRADETEEGELMSLVDICIDELCRHILVYDSPLLFDCLPSELVGKLLDSLKNHKAITKLTLQSLRECDVTRLNLSSCRDVSDDWLDAVGDKVLTHLSLASCAGVSDSGLLKLKNLGSLQHANLTGCASLRSDGLTAFRESWLMTTITLSGCRNLTDEALSSLSHLPALAHLHLRGCRLSDGTLSILAPLMPQLKTLDLNDNQQLSSQALTACFSRLQDIEHLDVGYCSKGMGRETLNALTRGRASAAMHVLILDSCRRLTNADLYSLSQLGNLRYLSLRNCIAISDAGLCQLPSRLESIDISHCKGVRRLPAQALPCLRQVNFAHGGLRDSDVSSLAEFPALMDINLDSCAIGNSGLIALSPLQKLRRLNLADTGVSNGATKVLASFPALSSLSLFYTSVSDAGVRHLSGCKNLTFLNLDIRELTDTSLLHISTLTKLRHLDVCSARVSDEGLGFICSIPELVSLEICSGRITDVGLGYIARLPHMRRLNVSQNACVTNAGLYHLGCLKDLEVLNVSHCSVAAPGAFEPLRKLRGLTVLAVNGCDGMSEAALFNLQRSLPFLRTVKTSR